MGAGAVVSNATLTKAVPIFVAIMVWLIRVLIIGTFSLAGDRLFSQDKRRVSSTTRRPVPRKQPQTSRATASLRPASSLPRPANSYRPAPKPQNTYQRPEPTYQNMSFGGRKQNQNDRYEV